MGCGASVRVSGLWCICKSGICSAANYCNPCRQFEQRLNSVNPKFLQLHKFESFEEINFCRFCICSGITHNCLRIKCDNDFVVAVEFQVYSLGTEM